VGQTAVHKHLLEMSLAIWWTHIHARGNPDQVAQTVRKALTLTGTPAESSGTAGAPPEMGIDTAQISRILGYGGRNNSGVYSVSIARAETIRTMGIEVPPVNGTDEEPRLFFMHFSANGDAVQLKPGSSHAAVAGAIA
jgi:hypothetical protein